MYMYTFDTIIILLVAMIVSVAMNSYSNHSFKGFSFPETSSRLEVMSFGLADSTW